MSDRRPTRFPPVGLAELQQLSMKASDLMTRARDAALERLRAMGLEEYFLYPQINWGSKAASIQVIAENLNIGFDTICFIDDDPFELAEVHATLPKVLCLDHAQLPFLLQMPELKPETTT